MSSGLNMLLPSLSKRKCCGLSLLNRGPEAELDAKLDVIRRDHARFKINTRVKETKLWDELYQNHRDLKASFVSKHSFEEVMTNETLYRVPRDPRKNHTVTPDIPFAEAYKQFVVFRAKTMVDMYGPRGSKYFDRPRYADLYAKTANLKLKNSRSMEKIRVQYEDKQKENNKVLRVLNQKSKEGDKQKSEAGDNRGRVSSHGDTPLSRPSLSRHSTKNSTQAIVPSNTPDAVVPMVTQLGKNGCGSRELRSRTEHQLYTRGPGRTYSLDKMPTITVSPKVL